MYIYMHVYIYIYIYIYVYIYACISFFLRGRNENKAVQLFCAIPATIDF